MSEPNEAIVRGDDWRVRTGLFMAVAANIPLYAGMADIAPEAVMDDGLLDVAVFSGTDTASILHEAGAVLAERLADDQGRVRRSSTMRVVASTPLRVHLDAEPFGTTPLTVSTLPRALRLIVPPTAPPSLFRSGPQAGGEQP
jgi:diacylglycerol kinase family enzyme